MYEVGDKVVHRVYKEWGTCTIHGVEDKHIHPPGEESDLVVTKKGLKKRNKPKGKKKKTKQKKED